MMLGGLMDPLLSAESMKNKAGAGFEFYEYPQWSTILGWLIFVGCIIPIPLVYIVNYIKEFRKLGLQRLAMPIGIENGNSLREGNDYTVKPRYLEAITQNNSPRDDCGPKKRINQYGLYAHLNISTSNNEIGLNRQRSPSPLGFVNQTF